MKKAVSYHILLISFLTLSLFLSSFHPALSAPKEASTNELPPCYKKEGMQRAAYIRSYITGFRENEKLLTLSKEQLDQIDEIIDNCDATCVKLEKDINATEKTLEAMLSTINENTDKKTIIEKVKELYGLKAKVDLAHFQLLGKAENLLTYEQKDRLKQIPRPPL